MIWNLRTLLFNTIHLLCGFVFIIFAIQSTRFEKSSPGVFKRSPPRPYILETELLPQQHPTNESSSIDGRNTKIPQIWITMGLCWSTNTQYYGKENFPYKESALLSAQLWMHLTPVKVILQVIYSEPYPTEELLAYKEKLENFGVIVKLVAKAPELKCVLEAQLIRIVAYLLPEVCYKNSILI